MYQRENPLFNLIDPLSTTNLKENARLPPFQSFELMNYLSNQAMIERLCQIRSSLEAQAFSLQQDIQQLESQLRDKKNLLSQKQVAVRAVENDQEKEGKDLHDRRIRRKARDVLRSHVCPVANCKKSYGSGASLYLHIRLKHFSSDLEHYKAICSKNKKTSDSGSATKHE